VRRDFVANVSHELKTPLTAIRGFAETLVSELSSARSTRSSPTPIRSNAERMHRLVDDLLDLSKIESGGWKPTPSEVDSPRPRATRSTVSRYGTEARRNVTR